eukprot:scaffold4642_cov112-Cylindrotheca_fusiformis.AAC.1
MMVDSRPSNEAAVPIGAKVTAPITPSVVAGGTEKINGSDPSGSPVATIRNSPTPAPTKKRKIANQESTVATAALPSVGGTAGKMAVPSTTTIPVAAAGNSEFPSPTTTKRRKGQAGSSKRSRWEEKFQQLFQYKIEHGHCNPSAQSTDIATRKIGIWVGTQRYVPLTAAEDEFRRQNGTGGQLKPLSEEEVRKLNAIGFDWRCPSRPQWDVRYQQLVKFKQIPREYEDNPPLGLWCDTQRKRKRLKDRKRNQSDNSSNNDLQEEDAAKEIVSNRGGRRKKWSRSPMTDEQEAKLLELGFEF